MANEQGESKYSKKLSFRKSRLGVMRYSDKSFSDSGQDMEHAVPLPLMIGFYGGKRGAGRKQQQVNHLFAHESFSTWKKFAIISTLYNLLVSN